MEKSSYLISDAAKKIDVEAHVLRYWEGELELPIHRNDMGHRYYTSKDVERFKEIKKLKEQGLQLKAIRTVLAEGTMKQFMEQEAPNKVMKMEIAEGTQMQKDENKVELTNATQMDKVQRLQILLQQMMKDALQENNEVLSQDIRASVVKEMDYQFRIIEEREEEKNKLRIEREEEHYKKIDELLRKKRKLFFK